MNTCALVAGSAFAWLAASAWAFAQEDAARPAARVDAFAVHLPPGTSALVPRTRGLLADCPATRPECWERSALGPPDTLVLKPPATRSVEARPSVGAAWEEAYRLRRETNAVRVEPLLEADTSAWNSEPETATATRGGSPRPDKPGAAADAVWSLKHIRVEEAWTLVRRATGVADGDEARGIIVAHPDTGYRPHEEIWHADAAKRPVLTDDGYDFYDDDHDALDDLDTGGFNPNPGHGTSTGSVIVSPKGRQMGGAPATEFVSGVAPGARIVPLRVHRSVVQFKTGNLARAIAEAAGDERTRVKKKADVISISMGGLPGWALWKAVQFARDKGVIVVAAAGNEVKTVVWPARFDEVVAVSASNVDCGLWDGTSHGGAVDITAPGESVWRAATDPGPVHRIAMGQGTSYAAATVAGTAALWLAYHRHEHPRETAALERDGLLTEAFLAALRKGHWRPDQAGTVPQGVTCAANGSWPPGEFGPGIIDARGLLETPLLRPGVPRSGRERLERLEDLPLFASLFPRETPLTVVKERYAALFARTDGEETAAALGELEAEIVNAAAMSPEVASALARLTEETAAAPGARQALLRTDISPTLRRALSAA